MFSTLQQGGHVLQTLIRGDVAPTVSLHCFLLCFVMVGEEETETHRAARCSVVGWPPLPDAPLHNVTPIRAVSTFMFHSAYQCALSIQFVYSCKYDTWESRPRSFCTLDALLRSENHFLRCTELNWNWTPQDSKQGTGLLLHEFSWETGKGKVSGRNFLLCAWEKVYSCQTVENFSHLCSLIPWNWS